MKLVDKIKEVGIENCIFLVPMKPIKTYLSLISVKFSSDEDVIVPATISEKRYKLTENYKITLQSTYSSFGSEIFYISDLEQLIKSGHIKFYSKVNNIN